MKIENIRKEIESILQEKEIRSIINEEGFYFEKAKQAYERYIDYKKNDIVFFKTLSILDYDKIQRIAETDEEVKEFLHRMEVLIAYCDFYGKDKNTHNLYDDKRVIARAGIHQNAWIAQLIKYRIDKTSVKTSIQNLFDFINSPDISISILSETHKRMISSNLLEKEYYRTAFIEEVIKFFEPLNIQVKNELNRTHIYTRIIYSLRNIWYDVICGLVARDNGTWKNDLKNELENWQYGVVWWNPRPVQSSDTLPQLENKIKNGKSFYIYYSTNGKATHRARVIDFSLAENYHKKSADWKTKEPAWYSETIEGYNDGRRTASIVFLIDQFIELDTPFPIKEFQMYKKVALPNRNNLSPYSSINNDLDPDFDSAEKDDTLSDPISRTDFSLKDKNSINGVIGVDDLAKELADIINKMSDEQGRMVGIFGEWGRGKTFLMNKLWKYIDEQQGDNNTNKFIRVDFHAWKYQDTPSIWAYLYEQFACVYYNAGKNQWNKFRDRFRLNIKRFGCRDILWFLTIFFFTCIFRLLIPIEAKINWVHQIIAGLGISVVVSLVLIYFQYWNPARELFRKYYTKASFTHLLGIQAEVQKELKCLVRTWADKKKNFKIFLFVDDIDRCSEEKIIQIIDALRVLLEDEELSKQIVIIMAVDERILKRAIKLKYHQLLKTDNETSNGESTNPMRQLVKEYLDKLFITGIKLGHLNPEERDEFFLELSKSDRDATTLPIPFSELETEKTIVMKNEIDFPEIEKEETESNKQIDTSEKNIGQPSIDLEEEYERPRSGKLTVEELNMLRKYLQLYRKVTPRQIRIFYFRYLIAKNLLIKQYEKMGRNNIWLNVENYSAFIELLIKLTDDENPDIVGQEKQKILNTKETRCKVELLNDTEINTFDYKILMGVLEIVIGY